MKLLVFIMAVFLITPKGQANVDCRKPSEIASSSIVKISSNESQASGIVIAQDFVLTAAHVIEEPGKTFVQVNEIPTEAQIVTVDPVNDLAILYVPTENIEPVPLSTRPLSGKQQVWAIGYPLGGGFVINSGHFEGEG